MKELSIEEKAKAYDEALEKAKEFKNNPFAGYNGTDLISALFPELKEGEDERIRKEITELVIQPTLKTEKEFYRRKELCAWLEKQGEHANFRNKIQVGDEVTRNKDGVLVNLSQLKRVAKPADVVESEKQGKQKPTDKVEPKFKVGDWISGYYTNYKVLSVNNEGYVVEDVDGNKINILFENEKFHHLWTIQDAKDGDVLAFNDGHGNHSIELIKSITDKKIEFWFCLTNGNRYEVFDGIVPYTNLISREDATPATKEQRDILFSKMKEAGYEWDAEKKELRKIENEIEIPFGAKDSELQEATYYIPKGFHAEIEGNNVIIKKGEQKPAWSEEDDTMLNEIIASVNGFDATSGTTTMNFGKHEAKINWLKTIKYKALAQLSDKWSEEDETSLSDIIKCLEEHKHCMLTEEHDIRINLGINFLKSLKYRVQPQQKQKWNEEDKNMLKWVIGYLENKMLNTPISEERTACKKAVDRLKSLRPQNRWKPSDEQLNNILDVLLFDNCTPERRELLESLYKQLKKL